ncbi:MAG TPA: LuxR C-terminal-related transcriptional regulator [Casimicrobiaceae bacterium]|jgi:DNA-binding CsgD family transcriptional regulator|nr:LuxR C-terminal-related transcriptional regulator [Casimicrobiaceae bacterium]
MINLAPALSAQSIRVFVTASDPTDRTRLRGLVLDAGHRAVESADDAELVLSDGSGAASDERRIFILAGAEVDQVGSLARDVTPAQLDAALRAAAAGLLVRSPELASPGFDALADGAPEPLLTPREIEVLECIGEGLTNKLIARRLDISLHTVKFHIESLLRKLGATTRAQALALLLERRRSRTIEF